MANPEDLQILKQGVKAWNAWRDQNRNVTPDLTAATLRGANLTATNLEAADLGGADPTGATNTSTMTLKPETSDTGAIAKDVAIPSDVRGCPKTKI
jgi:Pentapeptide repeats (8 copies)